MKNNLIKKLALAGLIGSAGLAGSGCFITINPYHPHAYHSHSYVGDAYSPRTEIIRKEKPESHFFACNGYRDLNRDGKMDYPAEFIGIKNKFREWENITLVSYTPDTWEGQKETLYLFSPRNELVSKTECTIKKDGNAVRVKLDNPDSIARTHGYGKYHAVWNINRNFIGQTDFWITR